MAIYRQNLYPAADELITKFVKNVVNLNVNQHDNKLFSVTFANSNNSFFFPFVSSIPFANNNSQKFSVTNVIVYSNLILEKTYFFCFNFLA